MKTIVLFYAILICNFAMAEDFCAQFNKDPGEFELTLKKESDNFSGSSNNDIWETVLFSNGTVNSVINPDLDIPLYKTEFKIGSAFNLGSQKYFVTSCRFNNNLKVKKKGDGFEYYKLLSVNKVYTKPFKITSHPIDIFKEFSSLCYGLANSGEYIVTLVNNEGNYVKGTVSIFSLDEIKYQFRAKRISVHYIQAYLKVEGEKSSDIFSCDDSYRNNDYLESNIRTTSHKLYKIVKIKEQ